MIERISITPTQPSSQDTTGPQAGGRVPRTGPAKVIPMTYRSTTPRTPAIFRTVGLPRNRIGNTSKHRKMVTRFESETASRLATLLSVGDHPTKQAVTPRPRLPQSKQTSSPALTKNMRKCVLRGRKVTMPHIQRHACHLRLPLPIGETGCETKPTHALTKHACPLTTPSREHNEATQQATTKSHDLIKRRTKDQGTVVPKQDLTQAGVTLPSSTTRAHKRPINTFGFFQGRQPADPSITSLTHGAHASNERFHPKGDWQAFHALKRPFGNLQSLRLGTRGLLASRRLENHAKKFGESVTLRGSAPSSTSFLRPAREIWKN